MTKPRPVTLVLKASYCCAALLALGCSSAMAAYSVIDDDLLPTRQTQATQDHYAIPFIRDRSALTDADRAILDMLIPRMNRASVRIVGRPDAFISGPEKASLLARTRANNIQDYLIRRGIAASTIKVEVDSAPNPQPNGSTYPCDLYIGSAPYPQRSGYPTTQRQEIEEYLPASKPAFGAITQQPQPSQTADSAANDRMARFINQALKDGQMEPSVALTLIRNLLATTPNTQMPQMVGANEATPRPAPIRGYPASPATTASGMWTLDKNRSLKQNLASWAKQERLDIEWDLPPGFEPSLRETTSIRAASFADAVGVVLQGLQLKGYSPIRADIYSDVVRFSQAH